MLKKGPFQMREKAGGIGEEREAGGQRWVPRTTVEPLQGPRLSKEYREPRWATSLCPSLAPSSCRVADLLGRQGASAGQSQPSSSQAKQPTWIYRSCRTVCGEGVSSPTTGSDSTEKVLGSLVGWFSKVNQCLISMSCTKQAVPFLSP